MARFGRRGFANETAAATEREKEILQQLSLIIDPDLHKDIVTLGFVQNLTISDEGVVVFDLKLTTPACPVRDQFIDACTRACSALPWVTDVKVTLSAKSRAGGAPEVKSENLSNVQNIVAVTSCKGGVGKSSVAVNLAYSIAKHGVKVGILDADIFGPSLPYLIPSTERAPADPQPYYHNGVKLMSMGYIRPGESVAVRGPMVSGMIQQMLTMTDWGHLDYLIIDYPPGTGDVQLTIGQQAKVDAAVVVTTPQQLSLVDVEKGIELFDKLNIPSIAVVENMAYFKCPTCSDKHQVFGRAADSKHLAEKYGIQSHVELPIDPDMARNVDDVKASAFPFVCNEAFDGSEASKAFESLADDVIRGVSKVL
ncbi:polysaccharide export protein, putative [Perkinsus marinus ATCC 50983]|uniref:Polysaccharide export protein, putative n=1 Tax=Perkinsus marinus (strain ATCC 50983 / TXsc) TaxID=423536 RepID=C5KDC8_PERM5|nr:polysaccharide export protein, putative [Perkinsus marinus ATCC 50983]EER17561.1 polysaccharide export protein, putative [Perkinsus marinus ATCC 50983]|eukprot:XP_002785765.1 polysaccharide export protein, putative [Perkinsus marinus ATCC 50983]